MNASLLGFGQVHLGRLQDFLDHMSLEDIRRRFFAPIRELSPELSWHLSHPDPVREVATVGRTPEDDNSSVMV